jgi:hypothetical protein
MSKRVTSDGRRPRPTTPEPAAPDRRESSRPASALQRLALPLALCLILAGSARIVSTYRQLSVTKDEPEHFECGLEYLSEHHICQGAEHPPLERAASAFLPFAGGARTGGSHDLRVVLREKMRESGDPWGFIARMRAGVLPFFVLAALVVFFAARWLFGAPAALASTALFTMVPPVLAHAGLATTDIAVTATLPAAFFLLAWWSASPSWQRALAAGGATGLAVLSKFTTFVCLPACAAIAAAIYIAVARPDRTRLRRLALDRAPTFGLAVAMGALVIWAGYLFSFGPVSGGPSGLRVPAPELFSAMHLAALHGQAGHSGYLLGQFRSSGWWYFFPVALGVKTPIALLILAAIGLAASAGLRRDGGLLPAAFCLGILLPAMSSHVTIGVRHVLPVYVGLSMLGGLAAVRLVRWLGAVPGTAAVAVLIGWMAYSGAQSHPDYLGYFNEFAADRPDHFLVDSDLDWEQGMVLLGRRLRELGAPAVSLDFWHSNFATSEILTGLYGLPRLQPADPATPLPGWHAVSLTEMHLLPGGGEYRQMDPSLRALGLELPWYQRIRLMDRAGGYGLFLVPDASR